MKRFLLFFISVSIILSFCSCAGSNNHIPDVTDTQESCNGFLFDERICENADSYYLLRGEYIFVVDKKSHKCRPLCNKPDCIHDKYERSNLTNKCNAFAVTDYDEIDYYDGHLYFTTTRDETDSDGNNITYNMITRMNPDGSDREDIFTTSEMAFDSLRVHRGYIYSHIEALNQENGTWELMGIDNAELYRMPVGGGEWEKLDGAKPEGKSTIFSFRFYGDTLYELFLAQGSENTRILSYDLKNKTAEYIDENLSHQPNFVFTVMNEKMYFDSDGVIYRADLNGNNCEKVTDLKKKYKGYNSFSVYNNDGKNVYIFASKDEDGTDGMYVLMNEKGKTKSYELPTGVIPRSTGNVLIKEKGQKESVCWLELNKTGKVSLTEMYEIG